MLGHSDQPTPLMNTADVVLMCSRREAFGRVTVEGMKLGKPVIGTRSGGTPEIVIDGQTGYLYQPGDAKELAARIHYLHANRSVREAMGAHGRRHATAQFNQEKYATEVENVLKHVTRGRSCFGKSRSPKEGSCPSRRAA
jgi:glycosyltransferase involved in cell wall biosynthesis